MIATVDPRRALPHDQPMTQLPDDALSDQIRIRLRQLLAERGNGRSISLAEAAQVIAEQTGTHWHELMRPVRTVVAALASQGLIDVIQEASTVDVREIRGPVRLRLRDTAIAMSAHRSSPD